MLARSCKSGKEVPITDPLILMSLLLSTSGTGSSQHGETASLADKRTAWLIERFKDRDHWVHQKSIEALGKIGKPAAPAPIEALKDEKEWVRWSAIEALGRIAPG